MISHSPGFGVNYKKELSNEVLQILSAAQAVLIDLDGTLVDSERLILRVWTEVMTDRGYDLRKEFYSTLLGRRKSEVTALFYAEYGAQLPLENLEQQVKELRNKIVSSEGLAVKAGSLEMLTLLGELKIPRIVATSTYRAAALEKLSITGLINAVDGVVAGDEVARGKPEPDIWHQAALLAKVDVRNALVIEDSAAGVESGFLSGARVIAVPDIAELTPETINRTIWVADSLTALANGISKAKLT